MRKSRNRKTELIHNIRRVWQDTDKGKKIRTQEEFETTLAIMGTLFYLDIFDVLKVDRQKEYFKSSHLSTYNNKTQVQLSLIYNISKDTISDYCSKHIEIFEECLTITKELIQIIGYQAKITYLPDIIELLVQNRKK